MSIIGTIYEDVTTDALGDIGSWQWLVTFMSTLLMTSSFFQHYSDVFLLYPNHAICIPAEDHENFYNETLCSYTLNNGTEIRCDRWHLKLLWVVWIKKSWLLFCDDKMKLLLTAVIFRLATSFGFIIFGLVGDSFGRRNAIIVSVIAVLALRAVATFCDSEAWFRLVLFMEALFGTASMFMGLVIVSEIASNNWRSWLNVIVMSPRLVALVSMVDIANAVTNPETYNLIGCSVSLVLILILKWLPESPQWMLYNRKIHVAEKVLSKAAVKNSIKFSAEFKIRPVNQRAYLSLDETTTCFRMLSMYNIRVIIAVTVVFWGIFYFIWGFLYLKIYSEGIGSSILLKVFCFLGGMGFLTAVLSNVLTLQRFLVIYICVTALITSGVIILKNQIIHEILSSLALASGIMVHALLLNMTPRFFGINIRATLFGCCNATGQVGAMISYIIFIYQAMDDNTFVGVQLALSLILVGISFVFPKVDGREMPDVMADMDTFSELSKPLRWATQKRSNPSKEEIEMRVHSFLNVATASMDSRPPMSTIIAPKRNRAVTPWRRLTQFFQKKKPRVAVTRRHEDQTAPHKYFTHSQTTEVTFTNTSLVDSLLDKSKVFNVQSESMRSQKSSIDASTNYSYEPSRSYLEYL